MRPDTPRPRGPLGQLVDEMSRPSTYPDLPLLDEVRRLWTQVRSESQLRLSHEPAPSGAGPLNSAALVYRAIALMREQSPDYLRHFLSYVDDLSWLEQVHAAAKPSVAKQAPGVAATPKRARKGRSGT
ncbi:DUF2894 domain-containing protein [Luteibacter sahnii]|uniref:DUF2894 domain-containing protein n=1 Tax=Luteibacter sahnii TaxID=3021977 RepID=UPI00387E538A